MESKMVSEHKLDRWWNDLSHKEKQESKESYYLFLKLTHKLFKARDMPEWYLKKKLRHVKKEEEDA